MTKVLVTVHRDFADDQRVTFPSIGAVDRYLRNVQDRWLAFCQSQPPELRWIWTPAMPGESVEDTFARYREVAARNLWPSSSTLYSITNPYTGEVIADRVPPQEIPIASLYDIRKPSLFTRIRLRRAA